MTDEPRGLRGAFPDNTPGPLARTARSANGNGASDVRAWQLAHDNAVAANPLKSLGSVLQPVRNRWRLPVAGAIAGALLGCVLYLAFPPSYTSTTTMVLGEGDQTPTADLMQNEAALLKTRAVAQQAVHDGRLRVSADQLLASYRVQVLSSEIIKVALAGPTGRETLERARALATGFLSFRNGELQRQADATTSTLRDRSNQVNAELTGVNSQITTLTAGGDPKTDAAIRQYGDLLSQRSTLSGRLRQLQDQIEAAQLQPTLIARQSRILDPPVLEPRKALKTIVTNGAAGTVGGAAVVGLWVIVAELTMGGVRGRDEAMRALRAPVAVGIGRPLGSLPVYRRLLRRPAARGLQTFAPVRRELERALSRSDELTPHLVVVSHGTGLAAAVAVASTSIQLVDKGKNVVLADLTGDGILVSLFGRGAEHSEPSYTTKRGAVWVVRPLATGDANQDVPEDVRGDVDAVVALATVDVSAGALHLAPWGKTAVVFAAAGRSTADALRATARTLAEARIRVVGGVLVGADRRDRAVTFSEMAFAERGVEAVVERASR